MLDTVSLKHVLDPHQNHFTLENNYIESHIKKKIGKHKLPQSMYNPWNLLLSDERTGLN